MNLETAIEKISAQQPKARNDVWMVGEQLKDILRDEPEWAEMVARDLENPAQRLEAAAQRIRDRAKQNRAGNVGCVTPAEADEIIRKLYGIPPRGERRQEKTVRLEDFF